MRGIASLYNGMRPPSGVGYAAGGYVDGAETQRRLEELYRDAWGADVDQGSIDQGVSWFGGNLLEGKTDWDTIEANVRREANAAGNTKKNTSLGYAQENLPDLYRQAWGPDVDEGTIQQGIDFFGGNLAKGVTDWDTVSKNIWREANAAGNTKTPKASMGNMNDSFNQFMEQQQQFMQQQQEQQMMQQQMMQEQMQQQQQMMMDSMQGFQQGAGGFGMSPLGGMYGNFGGYGGGFNPYGFPGYPQQGDGQSGGFPQMGSLGGVQPAGNMGWTTGSGLPSGYNQADIPVQQQTPTISFSADALDESSPYGVLPAANQTFGGPPPPPSNIMYDAAGGGAAGGTSLAGSPGANQPDTGAGQLGLGSFGSASPFMQGYAQGGEISMSTQKRLDDMYNKYWNRDADQGGIEHFGGNIEKGITDWNQVERNIRREALEKGAQGIAPNTQTGYANVGRSMSPSPQAGGLSALDRLASGDVRGNASIYNQQAYTPQFEMEMAQFKDDPRRFGRKFTNYQLGLPPEIAEVIEAANAGDEDAQRLLQQMNDMGSGGDDVAAAGAGYGDAGPGDWGGLGDFAGSVGDAFSGGLSGLGDAANEALGMDLFAEGGEIDGDQGGLYERAKMALMGQDPDPRATIDAFVQQYGKAELQKLMAQVQAQSSGRKVEGPGDGMSDSVPANIDGREEIRVADGEFIIPADVVSMLGNGSSDAGVEQLEQMMAATRQEKTGTDKQAPAMDPRKVMPMQGGQR